MHIVFLMRAIGFMKVTVALLSYFFGVLIVIFTGNYL